MGMRAKCTKEEKAIADAYAKKWLWDFAVCVGRYRGCPVFYASLLVPPSLVPTCVGLPLYFYITADGEVVKLPPEVWSKL